MVIMKPLQIVEHPVFSEWLDKQTDRKLIAMILNRLDQVKAGNLGDHCQIVDVHGLAELRIHYGPGYRIYYTMREREIVILLCAGDKSEQKRSIKRAKLMVQEV